MKLIARWGGLLGILGGLIWAVLFYLEATDPGFDLRNKLLNQPVIGLALAFGVALQAAGFYSLSVTSRESSVLRISATVCASGALLQSLALLAVSGFGLGAAWLFGILGELVITIALGIFAISSLPTKTPLAIKVTALIMVPFYFVGWAIDPGAASAIGPSAVNLSAAIYGLLWIPLGFAIWHSMRAALAR